MRNNKKSSAKVSVFCFWHSFGYVEGRHKIKHLIKY